MAPIPSKIVYSLDPGTSPTPTPTITITPTPSVTPTLTPTKTPFPTPLPNFGNECGHLTVFEMGVSCVVVNPSTSSSNDGAASLEISGGTPPYTVIWENGNIAPAIGNLAAGEYDATVFDYYGDYSAKTTCVLVAPVPGSPTPTPTPTPTPLPSVFCMLVKYIYGETKGSFGKGEDVSVQKIVSFNREFSPSTNINGQPSWLSDDLNYLIYWNNTTPPGYWSLSGSSTTNYATSLAKLTNNNPLNPFTSGDWQLLGGFNLVCNITLGPCTSPTFGLTPFSISNPDIELFVVKSDTKCGCDGSIFINASGGNVPYQFSVDGGVTYKNFPLFDNLCFGNYTVGVLDASGYTKTTQITLNEPQLPITYYANLITTNETVVDNGITLTKTYRSTLDITPPLPDTVTLTFDVVHSNNFQSSISPTTSQFTSNTVLEVDTIPINYSYSSSTTGTTINTRNGCQNQLIYTTGTSLVWQAISYTSSNELIINTTTSVNKNFTSGCDIGDFDDRISIINLRINGCSCCNVQNTTV